MNHFCYQKKKKKKKKKKKNLLGGIGINVLNLRKKIFFFFDHNKFDILSKELGNRELSAGCIVEKFINTTNSIAKGHLITSLTEIRKALFRNVPQNLLSSKG